MDAQQAIERLYEDESLTSALEDSAAQPLMKWAERQLTRIVQSAPDEPRFEQDFMFLRKLIKRIGRYIDRRKEWSEAEQADELDVIKRDAARISAPLTIMTPADYLKKPALEIVASMIGAATVETAMGAIATSDPDKTPTSEVAIQPFETQQTDTSESPVVPAKGSESEGAKGDEAQNTTEPENPPKKTNLLGDLIKRIFEE